MALPPPPPPPPPPPAPSQPPPAPPPPTASDAPPPPAPSQNQPAPISNQSPPPAGNSPPPTQSNTGQSQQNNQPPKGKMNVGGLGTALSLDLIVKPSLVQPSMFPTMEFGQAIPKEILMNDQTMMGLLTITPLYQTPFKEELDLTQ